jgi:hypothetical protein
MITHLWARFGRIDERDLQENRERLAVPWDASQPIDTLFACINRCKTLADAGSKPMADSFLTHSAFMLIEKTYLFTEACRIWRMKPQDTRTYALCQEYFYEAHRELSKTTASGGYHSANAVKEAARDAAFEKLSADFLAFKAEIKNDAKLVPYAPAKPMLFTAFNYSGRGL